MDSGLTPSAKVAGTIVSALVAAGVERVSFCPGSRNAPFAYALAAEPRLETQVFADERAGAFWALGVARTGEPGVVFTTSGTAAAELHPALEEAKHIGATLVAITADRPWELRNRGANQTTEQMGLYGTTVGTEFEIPAEDPTEDLRRSIAGTVARALNHRGPSHLNVAFREPLTPGAGPLPEMPLTQFWTPATQPVPWDEVVDPEKETVVVAGDGADQRVLEAGLPILAEPSANAGRRVDHVPLLIDTLGADVEQVVVTGKPTLTRSLARLLRRSDIRKIVVGTTAIDPSSTAEVVVPALSQVPTEVVDDRWQEAARRIESRFVQTIDKDLNLLSAARTIWDGPGALWLGPSNTIRAFDIAAAGGRQGVYSPRGLAGIDGNISQALGVAAALGEPVRVVLGDLTFAYDLNVLGAQTDVPLQVVIFADGGGSIFASLEHGEPQYANLYEKFFAAPQRLDIIQVAGGFGWQARTIASIEELRKAMSTPVSDREIIVVPLPRPDVLLRKVSQELSV